MTNGTLGQKDSKDHPTGLFWYHPHVHMTTSRQGWKGLSGAIIVEGGLDDHPAISQMQERLMGVNELLLDKNGQVPYGVVLPIEPLQSEVIPSPGRIEGTDSVYQFDFRKKGPDSTTVTLVANPPVSWLQNPYTLTVTSRL